VSEWKEVGFWNGKQMLKNESNQNATARKEA
jgi:hypothetical protein